MKLCIATGGYYKPGETFINRHIAQLFAGETCVITHRRCDADPLGKAVAVRRPEDFAFCDLWERPLGALGNQIRHGTSKPPVGRTRRALVDFLHREGADAILVEFGSHALPLAPLAKELGLPIFAYFRGYDASEVLRRARRRAAYRRMMPHLAGIFAVSQFLLDNLAAHGITHPHSMVLPSGVETGRFPPAEAKDPGLFVAAGRFVAKKAPQVTVRAFCAAARDHPHARLEMFGDGPLMPKCRAIAADAGMSDRVIFHGARPQDVVRARLAESTVFLQHSVTDEDGNTEGLPTVIQEAMAAGAVVVSTRHAGIADAIDEGETGWLVAEHDEAGFTDRIARALATPEALAPMATLARHTAIARFDSKRLFATLEHRIRMHVEGV